MSYPWLTLNEIYRRIMADMEARVTGGAKIPSTSLLSVFGYGVAGGSFLLQGFIKWVYDQILPDLSGEEGIDRWSRIYRLPRKAAQETTGEVSFTGVAGSVVPTGTEFENQEGLAYETKEIFTIGTTVSVEAEALQPGADWNVTSGLELIQPLTGVDDDITIVSGFDDGVDEETFDNWVIRILQRTQNPPSSGNQADYERWALEVEGVFYAWCFPAEEWGGDGTVGLAASGEDFAELTAGILADLDAYIRTVRPIPAGSLTVYTPTNVVIEYDISITPNTEEVQQAVTANIQAMYDSDAAPDGTIYISRTGSAISTGGASDYIINDIDKGGSPISVGNFTVTKTEVPVLGEITFSAV